MPPKRRGSSVNAVTAPLPTQPPSPSKIPRRKSVVGMSTTVPSASSQQPARRRSSLPHVIPAKDRITPRNSLVEDEISKETPYAALKALASSLVPSKAQPEPTPRRPPQTPARKTPAVARTPGTVWKTPRGAGATGVATPHTARAVKQLQLTVGRSGGVRSVRRRTEIRRESQRDVLRALSRALPKDTSKEKTARLNDTRRSASSSSSPPPPNLESRLSTPSSDDMAAPRLSLSHDPLAPTRTLHRTPPAGEDDTIHSVEGARRAPLNRLSDRLSFGLQSDDNVDDTMMDILANRPDPPVFGDESFDFGPAVDDDTVDLRNDFEDGEGEYTEALRRELTPPDVMDLDIPTSKPKAAAKRALKQAQKLSRHGIPIPSLPQDLIRNLAQQFSSKTLSKDALPQIERATDEFFRNISSDLATFAKHAGRKGIEETDVQMLLQRQRLVKSAGAKNSVFSVARKYLPGELLGRVRMVKGGIHKRQQRKPKTRNQMEEED